jgi:MoaA/NifB/PqqE/SkfB family radical SAM enzyme
MQTSSIVRLAAARAGLRPVPLSLGFELTHLCNLSCRYCDRHTPLPNEMRRADVLRVLAEFYSLGTRHVSLDGGEPLAHGDIDEIVRFLCALGVRVYMNTNGILIPKKLATVKLLTKVKISLDGPPERHDAMRGAGSFERAVRGAVAARDAGVGVELTCVVGIHNADHLDALVAWVEHLGFSIVFQPARNSLFLDNSRDGSSFQLDGDRLQATFARIEQLKEKSAAVGNRWSSLRHFRHFPDDTTLPCAAGWINATLDPEGYLFHCALVSRSEKRHNVLELGAREAFARLTRRGCGQCWCARVVEENYAWGGRFDTLAPARPRSSEGFGRRQRHLPIL